MRLVPLASSHSIRHGRGPRLVASWVAAIVLTSRAATAQPGAPPKEGPSASAEGAAAAVLAEEEQRQLERALEADARARDAPAPVTVTPPSAARPALGGVWNPDLAILLQVAAAAYSDEPPEPRGAHDPERTGVNMQALELYFGASVDPYLRLDGALVVAHETIEIEEAQVTTLALPAGLQARAGVLRTRFGRINALHLHRWHFVDAPLVLAKFFGPEGNRGVGAELSWLSPLPWYLEVAWALTDGESECCGRSFAGEELAVEGPHDLQSTATLKQFFPLSPSWSLATGLSGAFGPNDTGHGWRSFVYGGDLYLRYRPVHGADPTVLGLEVELVERRRRVDGGTHLDDRGLLVQLHGRFAPRWSAALRYDLVGGITDDPLDPLFRSDRHRGSLSVTFEPSEFSRLRAQVSALESRDLEEPLLAAFLALEASIGAHAAHPF